VAFLASETFHFRNGHAFDAHTRQSFFNVLEFEGFDDGLDFFHDRS